MDIQVGDLYKRFGNKEELALVTDIEYDEEGKAYLVYYTKINSGMDMIFSTIDFLDYYDPVAQLFMSSPQL